MTPKNDHNNWFAKVRNWISVITNIAVIAGIIFAYVQIKQANRTEKRRIAIEAVSLTRTAEFLKAYSILKTAYNTKKVEDKNQLIDKLNYVMNVYDNIAILFINDLGDKCIIKNAVYPGVTEFYAILNSMQYPYEYKKNVNTLVEILKDVDCN